MAEETNPANPDETKTQGDAADDQPAAKKAAPKAEAAAKRPVAKKAAKQKKEQPAPAAGAPETLSLSTEEVDKPKIVKAKGSKNVHSGIAHVMATFNNTIVTITDMKGNVIGWSSAGKVGFKGSRKSTAYAAQMVAQDASRQAMGHGLKEVEVLVKGPGAGRESAVRALHAIGLDLTVIRDVTPVPHNGCRPPKQRRVSHLTSNVQHRTSNLRMARYTGPKTKVSRRYGVPIFGSSKALERKNYPPGIHGPRGARRKQSDYAIALGEKQKLRYQYGLLERQFRRIFQRALRKRGVTGETLLQLLETRLDNVVYRFGFANTRSAARQLVSHGHVLVNGRRVNIASYNVKAGNDITIKDKPKSRQLVLRNLDLTQIVPVPDWLTVDRDGLTGKVARIPSREEMQPIVNEQLVVELYSR